MIPMPTTEHITNYTKTISYSESFVILEEELAELIQAVSKTWRNLDCEDRSVKFKFKSNLCEEIAHVLISLNALQCFSPELVDERLIQNYMDIKNYGLKDELGSDYQQEKEQYTVPATFNVDLSTSHGMFIPPKATCVCNSSITAANKEDK